MEKKFEETLEKCVGIMNDCGFELPRIEFKLNGRFTSTLGRCIKLRDKEYMIEISKRYAQGCIETGNIRKLEQTVLHEMAHTLPNGYDHGKIWKSYADIINTKFGYKISRLATVPNEIRQYWIKDGVMVCCDKCNKDVLLKRSSDVVQNIGQYKCSCGGKLKIKEVI
jgi:predicted SprT family Zn-dependent metalloprotease